MISRIITKWHHPGYPYLAPLDLTYHVLVVISTHSATHACVSDAHGTNHVLAISAITLLSLLDGHPTNTPIWAIPCVYYLVVITCVGAILIIPLRGRDKGIRVYCLLAHITEHTVGSRYHHLMGTITHTMAT